MRFVLDENIPAPVLGALIEKFHEAKSITDLVPGGSPDQLVAAAAEEDGSILVSHDRDFRRIAPRVMDGQQRRFRRLSIVHMDCAAPRIVQRLVYNLPVIAFELEERRHMRDGRLIIAIRTEMVHIHR
jgi:predicted nuclease of predicted toxin-antitoxin system